MEVVAAPAVEATVAAEMAEGEKEEEGEDSVAG
jgi:hypothetical protein